MRPRRDPHPETAERILVDLGESGQADVRDSGQAHVRPLNEGHRPLHAAPAAVERARCNHGAGSERQHRDRCRNTRPRTRAATLLHDRHFHLPGVAWEWLPTIRWAAPSHTSSIAPSPSLFPSLKGQGRIHIAVSEPPQHLALSAGGQIPAITRRPVIRWPSLTGSRSLSLLSTRVPAASVDSEER